MLVGEFIDAVKDMFFTLLYRCFSLNCMLIDFLKDVFYMLCGIDPVRINGESSDLLTSLLGSDMVRRAFYGVFLVGAILLVVFTILAILKTSYQEKSTVSGVLKKSGRAFLIAILLPFLVTAGILLTNAVMKSINLAMTPYGQSAHSTVEGEFLTTIGYSSYIGSEAKEEAFAKFVSCEYSYMDVDLVKKYFDIQSMNYLIGILGGFIMLVMFVLSSITFIQRIFDVTLLYLVSPVSVSTIPLDDGNRFGVWKNMMIGKILSAYGVILTMNLFFLIMPQVYQIKFFDDGFQNGVVYTLFLIGGSFAITKANDIIARLCGSQQGGNEMRDMIYNVRSMMALSHAVNNKAGKALGKFIGGSAYTKSRARGGTRIQSLKASSQSKVNQKPLDSVKRGKQGKVQKALKTPLRFATMPAGMIHDLSQGGVIAMGKNFVPRLDNALHGTSLLSHAEVAKKKAPKAKINTEASGQKSPFEKKSKARPTLYRRDDKDRPMRVKARKEGKK